MLAAKHKLCRQTIWNWTQKEHPALGRRVRFHKAPFEVTGRSGCRRHLVVKLLSSSDVERCVTALRHPTHYPLLCNPGVWIHFGIFQHTDGRLFYSERYVRKQHRKYGLPPLALYAPVYRKRFKPGVEILEVVWTGGKGSQWWVDVFSAQALESLARRRDGHLEGGQWVTPNQIWHDADGVWYSSEYLAREAGLFPHYAQHLLTRARRDGELTRCRRLPRLGRTGGWMLVYHQGENRVQELLARGRSPLGVATDTMGQPTVAQLLPSSSTAKPTAGREAGERLTPTQDAILQALSRSPGPLDGPSLANCAGYSYGHVRNELGPLFRRGLVGNVASLGYELTPAGRQLLKKGCQN